MRDEGKITATGKKTGDINCDINCDTRRDDEYGK
jgi:hypothetical protein